MILLQPFYIEADLRRFIGSQLKRGEKTSKKSSNCQNATFQKDVVRYHGGVNKAN